MRLLLILCRSGLLFLCSTVTAQDFAIAPASSRYESQLGLRKIFVGNNYRAIWATPVKMPLFDISTEKGGLTILKLGGGAQTKSLRFIDKDSIEWVLRTIDKDVTKLVPSTFKNTIVHKIIQEMISTAHPYAPLVVASLAKDLNLNAPDPKLVFVEDDTAFGQYRNIFANTVCLFEQVAPTKHSENAISTDSMLHNLFPVNNIYKLDDTTLLKARLLDMLIGDWDRHKDQYKWGFTEKNGTIIYYPIVRDRDQAFFYSDGLMLLQVRLFGLKFLKNFSKCTKGLTELNNRSWLFDKLLLSKLNENEWRKNISEFRHRLTDSTLDEAVKKLPREVYAKNGKKIFEKLKARRDGMLKDGMKYYKFLSENKKLNSTTDEEKLKFILDAHPGKKKKKKDKAVSND
ncbi:MAG: hypothetical protein QM737_08885 [Ferruginibacter sp.]